MRAFNLALVAAAAIGACGGRAQIQGSGEPSLADADASSSASGRTGSSRPSSSDDAGRETAGVGGSQAGAGGEPGSAGAPAENQGGNHGSDRGGDHGGSTLEGGAPNQGGDAGACTSRASFATQVVDHAFGDGQNANQTSGFPQALLGPPSANDPSSVVSLGNGGWVILGFTDNAIVDAPGADFTVFENPLPQFKELATVAVSDDGKLWTEFPCTAAQGATDYGFCAGVGPVYSSPDNGVDPLEPEVSGGDHFDLADIGVAHARYVRITDRIDLIGNAGVFDLDAVAILHGECR